jgi:hypothetical protein
MTQNTCADCKFWNTALRANGYGDCRANAPVAGTVDRWPVSEAHDWCGQWQQATATPPEPAPAGSLVAWVVIAIGRDGETARWEEARAAIRAVAEWLDSVGNNGSASELRLEANR